MYQPDALLTLLLNSFFISNSKSGQINDSFTKKVENGFHNDMHSSVEKFPLKRMISKWISFPRLFLTSRFVFFKFVEKRIHQIWWRCSLANDTAGELKLKIIYSCTRMKCFVRKKWKDLVGISLAYAQDIYTKQKQKQSKNKKTQYVDIYFAAYIFN